MRSSASAAGVVRRSTADLRVLLLGGSALCGIALAAPGQDARAANIMPTQGKTNLATATPIGALGSLNVNTLSGGQVTAGRVGYTSTGASATVTLTASRTLIDWTTFEVGTGDTLNFNFTGATTDIVINRVTRGAITVDAGGAVNGLFNAKTGGNIWFLAGNGVFINGKVTASGVLASNNVSLANLNLLSDDTATLKTELANGASLMDFEGVVTATGAEIDASGNIVLTGDIDAGAAGTVNLVSTGNITQSAGVITATSLTGTVAGNATLDQANQFDSLGLFEGTGQTSIVDITDAKTSGLTVAASGGVGAATIILTAAGPLTLDSNLNGTGGTVTLNATGVITQSTAGTISATNLNLSSAGGLTLTADNTVTNLTSLTNTGAGAVSYTNQGAVSVTGAISAGTGTLTLTTVPSFCNGGCETGPLTLSANITAGAEVDLVSAGLIQQTAGIITTGTLTGSSSRGASLTEDNVFTDLGAFTNTATGAVSITDARTAGMTVTGAVNAGSDNDLTLTTTAGPLKVNAALTTVFAEYGGAIDLSADGALALAADISAPSSSVSLTSTTGSVTQTGGVITTSNLDVAAGGGATLNRANLFDNLTSAFVSDTFSITDAKTSGLTVNGAVDANVITLTTTGGPLALAAYVTAEGGT